MAIFNSYVKLPEGNTIQSWHGRLDVIASSANDANDANAKKSVSTAETGFVF
jgi:hypothetical protein